MNHRVIILADRSGAELTPLDRETCPALIEVGGRTVIEYTLEDLAECGLRRATVISNRVEKLREQLGDGSRWGLDLSFVLTRPEQTPADSIRRAAGKGPLLLIRGDIVRGRCIARFLEAAKDKTWRTVAAVSDRFDAGMSLVQGEWTHGCTWPSFELGIHVVELGDIGLHRLETMADLHSACMAAARGDLPGVSPAGRETEKGLVTGRLSQTDGVRIEDGRLYVGHAAKVAPGVKIRGTVVIGSGALVDEEAYLEETVVMPGSYVGRHVELRNAIIAGSHLIRVDTGATMEVADDFLLSPLRQEKRKMRWDSWWDRLIGVCLLILSLPLWPLAFLTSLFASSGSPLVSRSLRSNRLQEGGRAQFAAWEWNTPVPLLRYLPWLLPVISGHLRIVGIRPAPAHGADPDRTDAPAGIVGPALLDVGAEATEEEIMLGETVFLERNNFSQRLRYLVRSIVSLFSMKAWNPAR
ncbi:MAG: NDP-sugar synthase [Gammaproteobacteria bacterium]|nr:MAG: NDP-sugar synthase [Gammaproteobacteria bacterium]